MKVILRNPQREIEISGRRRVKDLLRELNILPDTVLVIRGKELLTVDAVIDEHDQVEVRPVISGGSSPSPLSSPLRGEGRVRGLHVGCGGRA
jgi:sulfur carrier protein